MSKWDKEKKRLWTQNARKDPAYRESERINRNNKRKWLLEFKKTLICSSCGFSNPVALQFHHIREKHRNVCDMVANNCSIKTILSEIEKCIVLCANCHLIHHNKK